MYYIVRNSAHFAFPCEAFASVCLEMAVETPSPWQVQSSGCSQKGRGLLWCHRRDVSQVSGPIKSGPRPSLSFTPCLSPEQGPQLCSCTDRALWSAPVWAGLRLLPMALQAPLSDETQASFRGGAVWLGLAGERPSC